MQQDPEILALQRRVEALERILRSGVAVNPGGGGDQVSDGLIIEGTAPTYQVGMVLIRDTQQVYGWSQLTTQEVYPFSVVGVLLEGGIKGRVAVFGQFTLEAAWLEDNTTYYYLPVQFANELNVTKTKTVYPVFTHTTGGKCYMSPPMFGVENGSFYIKKSASDLKGKVLRDGNVVLNTSQSSILPCDQLELCCDSLFYSGSYYNRIITNGVCRPGFFTGSYSKYYVSETGTLATSPPTNGSKAVVCTTPDDSNYLSWLGTPQYVGQIVETLQYTAGMTIPTIPDGSFLALY